ncbi:MAG TPA: DNA mismatch repair endonuclease MutL [Spirochaetia bacterium]|nr:DNA mismatch repair endonuclease MutL [Spirochaetia bacterium]
MSDANPPSRRIRILREEVSRKIAAGEVIDRPLSIVRELVDNALDAEARSIDVYLEAGGISRIRVVDDGAGMGPEDLDLCWQAHATSKIEHEDDLLRVTSLGFRGEALSSIATCSRLSIQSSPRAAGERQGPAHRLEVRAGKRLSFEPGPGRNGTTVEVTELFHDFPARRKFLRSPSAESGLCRSVFVDRAVAHPDVGMRLFVDGDLKLTLPAGGLKDRIALAYAQQLDGRLLREAGLEIEGARVRLVAGLPELRRRDRKLMQVFVNGRRIAEYALLQAVEFGFSGTVPGGWHPVAFVLLDVDPSLVDFNIHPAKKEARFRNLPEVHRLVVAAVQRMLAPSVSSAASRGQAPSEAGPGMAGGANRPPAETHGPIPLIPREDRPAPAGDGLPIRYLGQVFGVFLIFELPGRLVMLDQHAAHERLIYDRMGARAPALQEMLFPLAFDASEEEAARIEAARADLEALGIAVQPSSGGPTGGRRAGARSFEVTSLSSDFQALPAENLVELLRGVGGVEPRPGSGADWKDHLRAGAACKLALKDGDPVDPVTARELCAGALRLAVPRCPHGRPIWHQIAEDALRKLVDRPVSERG